jgi:outer membrane biosynthesis protein TonB
MSEETEKKEGFFSNIKNQILTGAGVVLTTLGTAFVDEIKGLVGIEEEPTEQVQPQQQQQNNQQVVINIPEQKPAQVIEKTVIVKESPKPKPKKKTETEKRKEEGLDW